MTKLDDLKAERDALTVRLREVERDIENADKQALIDALQAYKPLDDSLYRVVWETPEGILEPSDYIAHDVAYGKFEEWALMAQGRYCTAFEFMPTRIRAPHANRTPRGEWLWMDCYLERQPE